jgi:hypothetical protein
MTMDRISTIAGKVAMFGIRQDNPGDPAPEFEKGDEVVVEGLSRYTEVWSVGDWDSYLKDRRYLVMDPKTRHKLWTNGKGMSKAKGRRAASQASDNHKDFYNKKDALAFLRQNALMSVGWPEGGRMKTAIYWNGKIVVTDADEKRRWASGKPWKVYEKAKNAYGRALSDEVVAEFDDEYQARRHALGLEQEQTARFRGSPNKLGLSDFHVNYERTACRGVEAARTAGATGEFSVEAFKHQDGSFETRMMVHGNVHLSAEWPDDSTYLACFSAVEKVLSRLGAGRAKARWSGLTKWGFDKVDFGTAAAFAKVLAAAGISALQEPKRGHIGEFIWSGSGIEVVTGNNPITGEYIDSAKRPPDEGYASYVGIEGNSDKVGAVVRAVKRHGDYEDESRNVRDFI